MTIKIVEADFAEFLEQQHLIEFLQNYEHAMHESRNHWDNIKTQYLKYIEEDVISKNGFIFLAKDQDVCVGMCIGCILSEIDIIVNPEWLKFGYVHELVILPEHQHKGIGQQLLNKAAERFRALKMPYMRLSALANNAPAIGCYKKFGFEPYELTFSYKL